MNYEEKYKKALDRAVNLFVTNNISATAACEIFPELNKSEEINYEKKYKEALERARDLMTNQNPPAFDKHLIELVFPELAESEDERIRKVLLNDFKNNCSEYYCDGVNRDMIIAWLEKQGKEEYALKSFRDKDVHKFMQYIEKQAKAYDFNLPNRGYDIYAFAKDILTWLEKQSNKSVNIDVESMVRSYEQRLESQGGTKYTPLVNMCLTSFRHGVENVLEELNLKKLEKQGGRKTTGKVEPKFHEGDWITNGDYTWKIIGVKPLDYILQSQDDNIVDDTISYVDKKFNLWTIADAKDGDVLVCESGWTCIFKTLVNDETFSSYCFMDNTKWFYETGSEWHTLKEEFVKAYNGKIYPATKSQFDLLFQKMKEAGYEWDAQKKEVKKIEPKFKVGDKVTMKGDNTVYTIGIIAPDKTCWLKHGSRGYGWATFGVLKHYVE